MQYLLSAVLILGGCSARESGSVSIPTPPSETTPTPTPSTTSSTSSSSSPAGETSKAPAEKPAGEAAESGESEDLSSVETAEERREGLEEKLDTSLEEFDGTIQREQEILDERRQASAPAGAGSAEAGGASGGASEGSVEAGGGETNGTGETSEGADGAEERTAEGAEGTGNSPDQPSGEPVSADAGSPEGGSTGPVSNRRVPPDVGDGRDDDIVARQIREAAMNEKDPELREKLWEEYRAYKSGQKKKD